MHCPFCDLEETKVIDSRLVAGNRVRRRRECPSCNGRFTTYEAVELAYPWIIKNDGERQPFREEKLRAGILRALEKRAVSAESIESAIQNVLDKLRACSEREVTSQCLGEWVMDVLRDLDEVAYVRFASVYRSFQDIDAFREEINRLREEEQLNQTQDENS